MKLALTSLIALVGIHCVLALPQTSPGTKDVNPAPADVTEAWKLVIRQVAPFMMSLKADLIPSEHYPKIIALARAWDALKDSPVSDEDAEKYWKSHYAEALTPEKLEAAKTALRRKRYASENSAAVTELRKLAGKTAYQMLVADGVIDGSTRTCLIFVPLPCPNAKIYEGTMNFMDESCKVAQQNHFQVLIVRSPYGRKDRMSPGGSPEETKLATRYDRFIQGGTVKLIDSMPGGTSTPWGFFYRSGELALEGSVDAWGQNPQPILKEFKP